MKHFTVGKRMAGDYDTLLALNDLWVEDHVFRMLDPRVQSFFGAYLLFKQIEFGNIRVYGAFDEDGELGGVCFGSLMRDGETFEAHIAFRRGYSAKEGIKLCEDAMIAEYLAEGVRVTGIVGYIPVFNRAAILTAKRSGYVDLGEDNDMTVEHNGEDCPCREMRKRFGGGAEERRRA